MITVFITKPSAVPDLIQRMRSDPLAQHFAVLDPPDDGVLTMLAERNWHPVNVVVPSRRKGWTNWFLNHAVADHVMVVDTVSSGMKIEVLR